MRTSSCAFTRAGFEFRTSSEHSKKVYVRFLIITLVCSVGAAHTKQPSLILT
jgi:hypothetical protein